MTTIIETPRLILRTWKPEDRPLFSRINADPLIMEYMPRVLPPPDSDKLVDRFERQLKKNGYGMYALERKEDGAFVGTVGLTDVPFNAPFTPAVEVAWRLDYEYWGQGYATESAHSVLQYAFDDLKLKEVVSFSVHDNTRAIHIMEKLGMVKDKAGEFDYPNLKKGHPLGRFVLYRSNPKLHKAVL